MKKLLLIFFIPIFASANKDSLLRLTNGRITDSASAEIFYKVGYRHELDRQPDSALKYYSLGLKTSIKSKYTNGIGAYFNFMGRKYYYVQNYDSANFYFKRAVKEFETTGYLDGVSSARNNVAIIYAEKGDVKKSIKEHRVLLELNIKRKRAQLIGDSYSNLGFCYSMISQSDSSAYYYVQALRYYEKSNSFTEMASCALNLASINSNLNQNKKALEYLAQVFAISKKGPLKPNVINSVYSLKSTIYQRMKQLDSAEYFSNIAIDSSRKSGDKNGLMNALFHRSDFKMLTNRSAEALVDLTEIYDLSKAINSKYYYAMALSHLGAYYMDTKDYAKAIENFSVSLQLCAAAQSSKDVIENLVGMAKVYGMMGDFKKSTYFLDSLIHYKDHLNEAERFKSLKEVEAEFETEKKDLQIAQAESELKATEEESKRKSTILIVAVSALFISLFFGALALFNFRKAKKFATTVQKQNSALEAKNIEIEKQKLLVEEKQHEIISSINYAQRIQSAVLTGEDVWKRITKEYFILFQPKDIVSGDFYWAHVLQNGRAVFAVADCTGHGVPGGFMSMLGNSFLNEIVVENKIFSASKILNKLREKIIKALEQKGQTQQQDGMDIALCVWNKMDNTLEFAGANNNLYVSRKGALKELNGNKMPIGTYVNEKDEFDSQTFQLEKGDTIYLTTDGYVDQFGGPKGKKYKYSQFETVLQTIQDTPLDQQHEILKMDFENWKGSTEQTDDVCLIGIKV